MYLPEFDDPSSKELHNDDSEVIRTTVELIIEAWTQGYSALSLDPKENGSIRLQAKFADQWTTPRRLCTPDTPLLNIVVGLKQMASLNINETALPQSGTICRITNLEPIFARVHTLPTEFGEGITIRFSSCNSPQYGYDDSGLPLALHEHLESLRAQSAGLVLAVGPSGSGRMNTLLAMVEYLIEPHNKLICIESEPSQRLPHATHVLIDKNSDLDYTGAMHASFYHEPDAIILEEIANADVAKLALQATIDQKWVFARLPVSLPKQAITHLLSMGLQSFMLSYVLRFVFGQRLIRHLCSSCKNSSGDPEYPCEAIGCDACKQTGYMGVEPIIQALTPDYMLKDFIARCTDAAGHEKLMQYFRDSNQPSFRKLALDLARKGYTTKKEAMRRTPPD